MAKSEEQKDAEADVEGFRKDLGPFVVAAETTRMAMAFTDAKDPARPIIFANNSFLSLTGYDREDVLGRPFESLIARGTDLKMMREIKAEFEANSNNDPEIRLRRKDDSEFWASLFVSSVLDDMGNVVQHFISFVNLTRHKEEQALAQSLIDELNHRVKNTLSTVQSIVWQGLRNNSNPEAIRESIEGRLLALARSHDLLTRENWTSTGLLDLIKETLEPFGIRDGRATRFVITGKNIGLPPKATLALGIAFHELATNALKYGAISNVMGSILISWTIESKPDGDRLVIRWQEKNGPPVTAPSRKGFGSQVIERGLAHELEGSVRLDFQPRGVICTIDVPAPGAARDR